MVPRDWRRRWRHHASLALGCVAIYAVAVALDPGAGSADHLSIAAAYACLLYMATALSIGPVTVRRAGAVPLNIYLRRDIGIWSALAGLVHFFAGVEQSMQAAYLARYVDTSDGLLPAAVARQLFIWGSLAGLVVALLVLLLLVLSSDRVLRRLGPKWWKRLQRSAYWAFGFTVAHGLAFQFLESRPGGLVAALLVIVAAVLYLQLSARGKFHHRTPGP